APACVVEVGCIRLACHHHGDLLDQPAARKENITDAPFEDAGAQAVERDLDAVADGGGAGGFEIEFRLECTGSFRMAGREVEEGIPAAAPLTGGALVERPASLDDRRAVNGDRRDERSSRLEREFSGPGAIRLVIPMDRGR